MFAFGPNNLKSIADITGKEDMDTIVVLAPHLPGINTFRRDPEYPKVETAQPSHCTKSQVSRNLRVCLDI